MPRVSVNKIPSHVIPAFFSSSYFLSSCVRLEEDAPQQSPQELTRRLRSAAERVTGYRERLRAALTALARLAGSSALSFEEIFFLASFLPLLLNTLFFKFKLSLFFSFFSLFPFWLVRRACGRHEFGHAVGGGLDGLERRVHG
jgi:hypothetical protein